MKNNTLLLLLTFFLSATVPLLAQGVWPDDLSKKGNLTLQAYEADTVIRTVVYNKDKRPVFSRESGNFPSININIYNGQETPYFFLFYDGIVFDDDVSAMLMVYAYVIDTDTLSHSYNYYCDLTDATTIHRLSSHTSRALFLQDEALCDCLTNPGELDTIVERVVMDKQQRPLMEWETVNGDTVLKKTYTYHLGGAQTIVEWRKEDILCDDYNERPSMTTIALDGRGRQKISAKQCYDEEGEVVHESNDTSYYKKDRLVELRSRRTNGRRQINITYKPSGQTKTSQHLDMEGGELTWKSEDTYFYKRRRAYQIVENNQWGGQVPKQRVFRLKWTPSQTPAANLPACVPQG